MLDAQRSTLNSFVKENSTVVNRAREWWERLGRTNQLTLVLTTLAMVGALIGLTVWASTPEYVPLFSNLSAQDANAIREKLVETNVPSRLTSGGTGIEVPAQYVDETRMKMISAGLPQQSAGATSGGDDIFNKPTITMTSEMEKLAMRRSLEDRVSKSIMSLSPVASASVHYAASDDSPLLLSNHDASAAVVVTCKPGSELSEDNVHAVLRLVQMSSTGLLEKNITIASSRGDVLWDGAQAGSVNGNNRVKQQRKMELDTRTDIQMALDRTIGPHRSLVLTHVELNNDEVQTQKHIVDVGAVVTKITSTEKLDGKGNKIGGAPLAPGAGVNGVGLPAAPGGTTTYPSAAGDDSGSKYVQEHVETTTEPSKTEIVTHSGQGKIEKLTVSVLLDSNQYKDPAALTSIQATIKNLVETNIAVVIGDAASTRQVSVAALPFDRTQELQEAQLGAEQRRAEQMRSLASLLVPFAIMGITLFLLARALRRPGVLPASQMPALAGAGAGMAALPPLPSLMLDEDGVPIPGQMVGMGNATEDMHDDLTPIALSTGDGAPRTYEVIEEAFDANLESILHMTRSKPDMVAMLVKSWVSEEI